VLAVLAVLEHLPPHIPDGSATGGAPQSPWHLAEPATAGSTIFVAALSGSAIGAIEWRRDPRPLRFA
jgi:hypothetical protein